MYCSRCRKKVDTVNCPGVFLRNSKELFDVVGITESEQWAIHILSQSLCDECYFIFTKHILEFNRKEG